MIEQIRSAVQSGDMETVLGLLQPDEQYVMSFTALGGSMEGRFYRFGGQVYATTLDTRPGQEEHRIDVMEHVPGAHSDAVSAEQCATLALSERVSRVRQAHAMVKNLAPELVGDMVCTHHVADGASLLGTSFAGTVIPDGMDPTV